MRKSQIEWSRWRSAESPKQQMEHEQMIVRVLNNWRVPKKPVYFFQAGTLMRFLFSKFINIHRQGIRHCNSLNPWPTDTVVYLLEIWMFKVSVGLALSRLRCEF